MICISIAEYGFEACQKAVKKCEKLLREVPDLAVEMRLDLCGLSGDEVRELFLSAKVPMIATCRKRSKHLYSHAILAGAAYIDIDVLSSRSILSELSSIISRKKTKVILSFHDYQRTPDIKELSDIYNIAIDRDADLIKIVTTAENIDDSERILSLYQLLYAGKLSGNTPLIAFSMGSIGSYTRLEALSLGAPLLYCALNEKSILVPGMLTISKIIEFRGKPKVSGDITIPTSKSIAQRAIIAASLAKGESEFHNFSRCGDIDSAVGVAKQISSKVYSEGNTLFVRGQGFQFEKSKQPYKISDISSAIKLTDSFNVFVGESGLLSRLCIPIAAQIGDSVTITGEGSLLDREMYGCKEALEQFKAKCLLTANDTLPAVVNGPLHGGEVTVSGKRGSQLISGLLMALPMSKKESKLTVEQATSIPYILLTIDVIKKFGIEITSTFDNGNIIFDIPGKQKYKPIEMTLEGDWSSAANFIVAGAIFGEILVRGLEESSHQADREIERIVKESGAFIEYTEKGIFVRKGHLTPFEYDATHSPDLVPILAVLAAYCEGTSTIHGINRLKNKESDRTTAICQGFGKMGVEIELDGDSMYITGISIVRRILEKKLLKGGNFSSFSDHRIAMALKIAAIGCEEKVTVEGMDCISKSFPTFETLLSSIYLKKK